MSMEKNTTGVWIVEPHEPVIFRDGQPFDATPGAHATSLRMPFPSTIAGGVRTQIGLDENGVFAIEKTALPQLKKVEVRGPLLVELDHAGEISRWLLPAPADALVFPQENTSETTRCILKPLVPLPFPEGGLSDLTHGQHSSLPLALVGLDASDQEVSTRHKPFAQAPRHWYWDTFLRWLHDPNVYKSEERSIAIQELGHSGPIRELRVHVAMDTDLRVGKEGALFDTSGLEFTRPGRDTRDLSQAARLALAVLVDGQSTFLMKEGIGSLGGERRIVSWRPAAPEHALTRCPEEIKAAIQTSGYCRLLLLTPAYFAQGALPSWLLQPRLQVQPVLQAMAIDRPQVVSGWDLESGRPKPTRRLAPAGTVLFLKLKGSKPESRQEDIGKWIDATWMQCVSDDDPTGNPDQDQYRRDGFGLAVLGTWSRSTEAITEKGAVQ